MHSLSRGWHSLVINDFNKTGTVMVKFARDSRNHFKAVSHDYSLNFEKGEETEKDIKDKNHTSHVFIFPLF